MPKSSRKKKKKAKLRAKAKGKAATAKHKAGARDSKVSSYTSPSKVGTARGSDDGLMSSKQSGAGGGGGSARVSVVCDVNEQGEPVWKTVDPNKLASGEQQIDKRLNGEYNLINLFIACVLTFALVLLW